MQNLRKTHAKQKRNAWTTTREERREEGSAHNLHFSYDICELHTFGVLLGRAGGVKLDEAKTCSKRKTKQHMTWTKKSTNKRQRKHQYLHGGREGGVGGGQVRPFKNPPGGALKQTRHSLTKN